MELMTEVFMKSINHFSDAECEEVAKILLQRAKDLRAEAPSYELAIQAGVKDKSYSTVRYGRVASYAGTAVVKMANGDQWVCTGHGPTGDAATVSREGYISFRKQEIVELSAEDVEADGDSYSGKFVNGELIERSVRIFPKLQRKEYVHSEHVDRMPKAAAALRAKYAETK